jgi:hypothetical protein
MEFHGQLAVGLPDFLGVGFPAHAEDFIVITLGHLN